MEDYCGTLVFHSFERTFKRMDLEGTKEILQWLRPEKTALKLCETHALHNMLTDTYDLLQKRTLDRNEFRTRQEISEQIVDEVLKQSLPSQIVVDRDKEGNTILHCAVYANHLNIAKMVMNHGAPLHIRNKYNMTPMESIMIANLAHDSMQDFLRLFMAHGATYHHFLENKRDRIVGTDFGSTIKHLHKKDELFQEAVLTPIQEHNLYMTRICLSFRNQQGTNGIWKELGQGPIVCFPKGLDPNPYKLTLQFVIPPSWLDSLKDFVLAVIPMDYCEQHGNLEPVQTHPIPPPLVNQIQCPRMLQDGTMYYWATGAMHRHWQAVTSATEVEGYQGPLDNRITKTPEEREELKVLPFDFQVCTISLDIQPTTPVVVCQLIPVKISSLIKAIMHRNWSQAVQLIDGGCELKNVEVPMENRTVVEILRTSGQNGEEVAEKMFRRGFVVDKRFLSPAMLDLYEHAQGMFQEGLMKAIDRASCKVQDQGPIFGMPLTTSDLSENSFYLRDTFKKSYLQCGLIVIAMDGRMRTSTILEFPEVVVLVDGVLWKCKKIEGLEAGLVYYPPDPTQIFQLNSCIKLTCDPSKDPTMSLIFRPVTLRDFRHV